jgi:segregation and condensation protein B
MNIELTADQAETPMTEHEGLTDHHAAGEGGDRVMGAGVTGGGGGSEAAPVKQPAASPGAVLSAGEQAEAAGEGTGGDGGEAEADSDAAETVREGGGGDSLELLNALQCLLFVAGEPLPVARLSAVLGVEDTDVPRLCGQLNEHLSHQGLHAVQLAGGWALATRPQYADYVQRLVEPEPQRLSMPALETLAIIAYRQPITRPEIDALRGVNSGGVVSSLMEKGLVRIRGRKDAPGKPFLLETTAQFLSAFGLGALTDLPQVNLPEVGEVSEQPKILGEALEELSPGVLETQTSLSEGAAGDERAADSGERDKVSGETYREMDGESSAARRETTGDGGGADGEGTGEGGEVAEQAADGARER